ncbi:MAG: NAD(P)H-dependent oxidoreductase subunit E [Spirochaetaceae bacterium]
MKKNELTALLAPYKDKPSEIIQALQELQRSLGYLPREALQEAAVECGVPYSYVYSIATFYKAFSLNSRGTYVIRICDGTACHMKMSLEIKEELSTLLEIDEEETTEDGLFSMEMVNCLGACAMAPVVSINGRLYGYLNRTKIRKIIEDIRSRGEEALHE